MQPPKKIIITSGYFNPLHVGHVNLIESAKKMGDHLVVIVNNDDQVRIKNSVEFMPQSERMEIIKALKHADDVMLAVDIDGSVAMTLEKIAQKYTGAVLEFAKGGDRNSGNIPEKEKLVCEKYGIKVVNGVGGGKIQSSSWLIKRVTS